MINKRGTNRGLERQSVSISESDLESARADFLRSGGEVQVVAEDHRKLRKQKREVASVLQRKYH